MTISPIEATLLKNIYQKAKLLETTHQHGLFNEILLNELNALLRSLATSEEPSLVKLSEITEHLHPAMPLRHYLNFLIPIERVLNKKLKDSDFIVETQDRLVTQVTKLPLAFVLDNIRSVFNVGSIYRLADCLGANEIYLCGYTPWPDEKTSLGTSQATTSFQFDHLSECLQELKNKKYKLIALETCSTSVSLLDFKFTEPTALLIGNERFGLDPATLEKCDHVIKIPMSGIKNSLNVSNALAIAAFEWKRQWIRSH